MSTEGTTSEDSPIAPGHYLHDLGDGSQTLRAFRCGDHVLHRPTNERWVVAYVDIDSGRLAWGGWPNGTANLSDCEMHRVATEAEHLTSVDMWRKSRCGDGRRHNVLQRYGTAAERGPR